ncbi:MAG: sugar transferase [Treponema sp.]|nr:sugar transferase [Treponema sp.]
MIRFFDILFSGLAIIILLPFMIPIMIGLKLTGEHDIFYKQTRIGKGGKPFGVLKFATMMRNSENMPGGVLTQKNDPRILPMGKFLRKTKINELPQLVNIFIGQMSVIGPRPQAKRHYDLYSDEVKAAIDTVAPGLSGLGSVAFRDEEDMLNAVTDRDAFHDTVIAPYKGALEVYFVSHRTLGTYFKLIWLTVLAVLKPSSKSWRKAFKGLPPVPAELEKYI